MKKFNEQVYEIVGQIPSGHVVSYGDIAHWLLHPRGARVVGWALARCPDHLPWHRVVLASDEIAGGNYVEIRRKLLEEEGASFLPDGRVDMEKCRWAAPPGVDKRY